MFDSPPGTLPWYVAGPVIGLVVPTLVLIGRKRFGISSSFRHICAAGLPDSSRLKPAYLRYDWRGEGLWNLTFVLGILLGAVAAVALWGMPEPGRTLSEGTSATLARLGLTDFSGFVPSQLISWEALGTPVGWFFLVGGGFLVGFGARYADGCTSGHAITGLSTFRAPSLVAVLGFFAGGLLATHVVLPLVLPLLLR